MEPLDTGASVAIKNCYPILMYFWSCRPDYSTAVGPTALKEYDTELLVAGCLRALEDDDWASGELIGSSCLLTCMFHSVPGLQQPMVDAGIHLALLRRYWKWIKEVRRPNEEMAKMAGGLTSYIAL